MYDKVLQDICFEQKEGCAVIRFKNRITIFNAERIRKFLLEMITENRHDRVVLSFDKLSDIDSIGISVLIRLKNALRDIATIRLCEVHGDVEKSLNYSPLNDYFAIDTDIEESIRLLNGGAGG